MFGSQMMKGPEAQRAARRQARFEARAAAVEAIDRLAALEYRDAALRHALALVRALALHQGSSRRPAVVVQALAEVSSMSEWLARSSYGVISEQLRRVADAADFGRANGPKDLADELLDEIEERYGRSASNRHVGLSALVGAA